MARTAGSNGEVTAQAIRETSLALFAREGYAAVSMRQIADRVGVQASSLYRYHANKQQLLVDIMRDHMVQLLEAWEAEDRPEGDPVAALEHFARFHIRYHIKRPDEVFISYMELRSLEEPGLREISRLRGRYETILKDILRRGMDDGVFDIADPHVAAMAILAMITGVNTWYRSGGRLSQARIEDIYVSMVLGSVGCRSEGVVHV
ncbi:TetR/AcrR family transcriptional regulator [Oricola thermophila]|uniref:TetR/AcrR family transcriptional regulator n=1 Tax=Oricola thermophila TaxID=2742145 RepID=A0A6N1VBX4_9HYPH|nr:TetR/AcrR family transcriptional regulator [Oricola thermophila]QKV17005.1 TetR/AcrR family transcriptional regulator [Oricola thermophila]